MPDLIPSSDIAGEHVEPGETASVDELDAIRELVLRAHDDVVPELVGGETVAGVLASVEPARAAYARLADGLATRSASVAQGVTRSVPAGGAQPLPVDPSQLPSAEKIRRGLVTRRS